MADFWEKKREQLQQQGKLPQPRQEPVRNGPWWDESGNITRQRVDNQPQENYDSREEPRHDFSKATHLQSKVGNCPNCGSGDYVKSSPTIAARCWNCGYIDGRQVNDLDTFVALQDAKVIKVKQSGAAHGIKLGSVADKNQIGMLNAQLEQSALGKAQIDSE